jgi:hypothetical protein
MLSKFPDWQPKFSPLVNTSNDDSSNLACGSLSTLDQEEAIKKVGGTAFWDRAHLDMRQPCLLWNNASVNANGDLLQCCRWDKTDWTYGNANEYIKSGWGFRDYWMQKMINKLRNPFCDRCNLKAPNWLEMIEKFSVHGIIKP